jgi:hypothetical protein
MTKGDWVYWETAGVDPDKIWAHVELYQGIKNKFFSDICFVLGRRDIMGVTLEREAWPILPSHIQVVMGSKEKRDLFRWFFEAEGIEER